MKPNDRIRLYAQLSAVGAVVIWGVLCFVIAVAPRMGRLNRTEADLAKANKQLVEMRKEIENASIIGQPAPGQSRYEKFGILGADEEELFLSDLIEFCKDTNNTLNLVRRADFARPATQEAPQKTGPTGTPVQPSEGSASGQTPSAAPQPVIERVPHTVSFTGTFMSSFLLLRKLESYKRLMTVERVEISTDSRTGWPRVVGNVTIDLFLVKNPGQPAGGAAQRTSKTGTSAGSRRGTAVPDGGSRL
jgi:hypothetical protein